MSGVTLKSRSGKVQPFVKAVGGFGTHRVRNQFNTLRFNRTDTGLAASVGAGLDYKVSKNTAIRLFEVDYLYTRLFNSYQNNVRISAGLVF